MCFENKHFEERVWPTLNNTDRAMSRSQRGPLAATPFVSVPSNRFSKFDPQSFRVLLRRRLRLPIPLSSRSCRCGANSTHLLKSRSFGETWFPSRKGSSTSVPCQRRNSQRRAADHNGDARRRKAVTYPEFTGDMGPARLVVLAAEVGGRFSTETAVFLNALAKAKSQSVPQLLRGRVRASYTRRRWEAIWACSAAQSFVMSLLERRPTCGTGIRARGGARVAVLVSVKSAQVSLVSISQ